MSGSLLQPAFLTRLAAPELRTVLLAGCGGGFDFVHALMLYPELVRLGKRVVVHSYSFGDVRRIAGGEVAYEEGSALVRRVDASCRPDPHYGPEVHACSFLDGRFPDEPGHRVYASYARSFTAPTLLGFYRWLVAEEGVDAVVIVDGGSDSLMVGDESGLGDPVEDAVSLAAVAALEGVGPRTLVSVGLGTDRFNDVSDAASLRAIAELAARGGFLGAVALEPEGAITRFYRDLIEHIYARQSFRSVIAGAIASAAAGWFGSDDVPPLLRSRVGPGQLYLWPLMSMLWAFDVPVVAARSKLVGWIREGRTPRECLIAIAAGRAALPGNLRAVEDLPRHEEARAR